MITINLPTALRQFTAGKAQVELEASTVGEALQSLSSQFPDLRRHLYNEQNSLRSFVNVYVNDEDTRHHDGEKTPLRSGDTLMIVPSIAGGVTVETDVASLPSLSNEEISRYGRHLIMPEVGLEGQRRLKNASVLMIGTGGLGAPSGMYLAAAGVGRIGIVDFDVVETSNLQRQIIHGTSDVGRPKIESARDRLRNINPHIEIETHETRLTSQNALKLLANYDIVVDGTDNFPTRYLVNDACVLMGKPNVYGSIFRFEGQASVFWATRGACYRCLYPEPPPPGLVPSCAEGGVLGVLPGIVGAIQANETIKLILGAPDTLVNRLLLFDAWQMKFREFKLRKDPDCPVCGDSPTVTTLIDYEEFCGLRSEPQATTNVELEEMNATDLKQRLDVRDDLQIIDVREPSEYEIARIPGSRLIPLGQIVSRMNEIDPSKETVVHCKGGVRSAKAISSLKQAGFPGRLVNLKGGISAWSNDVDPGVPKY
ncbi:MAG TPA: molybdopterin-synthase adenylyltransferase MoeB [Pyrinomonadaceae bacterium]|nr:molybdopterin-synthase adenylyltransferase MoeB [Pyrinomonadaceae bacterium]